MYNTNIRFCSGGRGDKSHTLCKHHLHYMPYLNYLLPTAPRLSGYNFGMQKGWSSLSLHLIAWLWKNLLKEWNSNYSTIQCTRYTRWACSVSTLLFVISFPDFRDKGIETYNAFLTAVAVILYRKVHFGSANIKNIFDISYVWRLSVAIF